MRYQLLIEPIGQTVEVEEGQNILDACLRAGIWLPHACCHGLCATCKVHVKDGEVEHGDASPFALMDFEREEGKTLACCATLQSDVVIEADIDDDPDAEVIPVRDYTGVVKRIETLTPSIKALVFALDHPMQFQAGQYVNLEIPTLGIRRAFSLATPPSSGLEVELNVRIVSGGAGTTYLHEQLKVGDPVRLSGPYGRFFVRKSAGTPTLFMAGGSGLSSPRSMILDLLEDGFEQPITLVYGQRCRAELYYHDEFLELARRHSNFRYVPTLSHEHEGSDWAGDRGFVHQAAKACFDNDFRGHKAYLCGPPAMIDACITTLIQGRLFERDIYTEKFLSAADAERVRSPLFKRSETSREDDLMNLHKVTLTETGESFTCAETESALSALARSGKRGIPLGCRGGGCGVCKVQVVSGEFRSRVMSRTHISEQEEANREVLACCIYPGSDIQLKVTGKLQRCVLR